MRWHKKPFNSHLQVMAVPAGIQERAFDQEYATMGFTHCGG
jgi:hypothetical protein